MDILYINRLVRLINIIFVCLFVYVKYTTNKKQAIVLILNQILKLCNIGLRTLENHDIKRESKR